MLFEVTNIQTTNIQTALLGAHCVAASSLSFNFSLNDISEVGETKLKEEGF